MPKQEARFTFKAISSTGAVWWLLAMDVGLSAPPIERETNIHSQQPPNGTSVEEIALNVKRASCFGIHANSVVNNVQFLAKTD